MSDRLNTTKVTQNIVRVLVVDDSLLIRKLLTSILDKSPLIDVVDSAVDAIDARKKIKHYNPDVITLDIEMPGMDGLSFLEKIMALRPMPVVMCSTLTHKGAQETLRALSIGAVDFLPKPTVNVAEELENYAGLLIEKVISAASVKFASYRAPPANNSAEVINAPKKRNIPKMVVIGSSTGGTVALEYILKRLPSDAPPIVIAQHIPQGFSAAFANRVNENTCVEVKEAAEGDVISPGHVYIAPGGIHLKVVKVRDKLICQLDDGEKVNRHKPSVDILFDSVCREVGKNFIGVILTGMGKDGALGMKAMFDKGVETIAQDEASSMVWGMPKQAIDHGGVSRVASLEDIPFLILEHAY